MTNFTLEKTYSILILIIFLVSYFLYSFLEPPIYTLSDTPGDTFYYLVYGREAADLRFFSWNGLYPSNGFHPLWLLFVAISFSISENLAIVVYILSIFLFIFFIISIWFFYKINRIYNDRLIQIISTFLFRFQRNCQLLNIFNNSMFNVRCKTFSPGFFLVKVVLL